MNKSLFLILIMCSISHLGYAQKKKIEINLTGGHHFVSDKVKGQFDPLYLIEIQFETLKKLYLSAQVGSGFYGMPNINNNPNPFQPITVVGDLAGKDSFKNLLIKYSILESKKIQFKVGTGLGVMTENRSGYSSSFGNLQGEQSARSIAGIPINLEVNHEIYPKFFIGLSSNAFLLNSDPSRLNIGLQLKYRVK